MYLGSGGVYVFHLVNIGSRLSGYYITRTGEVYSTRRGDGSFVKLNGSMSGGHKYYTLAGRTHSQAELLRMAKLHKNFLKETEKPAIVPTAAAPKSAETKRDHAKTVAEGITARGYVIGRVAKIEGEDALLFGSKPAIHTTKTSCDSELERLATLNPGVKFVSVKIVSTVVSGGLVWE